MLVLSSVNLGKEGLIIYLTQKSSDGCFCVFVSYRYDASVNFTERRCPGSKAMVFDKEWSYVTVPKVSIEDCNYTIAIWIRVSQLLHFQETAYIMGSSRFGKGLHLYVPEFGLAKFIHISAEFCREVSTGIGAICVFTWLEDVMTNWIHITVTCEQDNGVKIFYNGETENITYTDTRLQLHYFVGAPLPLTEFGIGYFHSPVLMDLHILGFALPRDEIYDLYRG